MTLDVLLQPIALRVAGDFLVGRGLQSPGGTIQRNERR